MVEVFLFSVTGTDSAATSSPLNSAELKVFHTYRSASCVQNRVRGAPGRLVSPCVKAAKCCALISPESEDMQGAQVQTGGVLLSSYKEPIPNVALSCLWKHELYLDPFSLPLW